MPVPPQPESGARERGFILVMLLAFITIMGIFLTVALPSVSAEIQRDQEAELIFRGEAIANAIRQYKAKTGSYPLNLEDLTKIRPRLIRKLYQDPMTREGDWDLITAVQPCSSGDNTGLPIVGVKSRCQKDSYRVYKGKDLISDWSFSVADNILGIPGGAVPPAANALLQQNGGQVPGGVDLDQLPSGPQKNPPPSAQLGQPGQPNPPGPLNPANPVNPPAPPNPSNPANPSNPPDASGQAPPSSQPPQPNPPQPNPPQD